MSYPLIKYKLSIYIIKLGNTSHNMNKNAKNVIFKVVNVAIYAFVAGKFLKFGKCACVKKLTNIMSGASVVALVTLVWLFSCVVPHHVNFQLTSLNAGKLTHCASVGLFTRVGSFVPPQIV